MPDTALITFVTCPPERAPQLAHALVEEGLAACVNILPQVSSVYRWQGAVQQDAEALLLIKTADTRFEALKRRVLELHPYELPEIVAVKVDAAHSPYLDWIVASCR